MARGIVVIEYDTDIISNADVQKGIIKINNVEIKHIINSWTDEKLEMSL